MKKLRLSENTWVRRRCTRPRLPPTRHTHPLTHESTNVANVVWACCLLLLITTSGDELFRRTRSRRKRDVLPRAEAVGQIKPAGREACVSSLNHGTEKSRRARHFRFTHPHTMSTSALGADSSELPPPRPLRIFHSRRSLAECCQARAVDRASNTALCGCTGWVSS